MKMLNREELLQQAETLQNLLVARATGSWGDGADYFQLRRVFMSDPALERLLPGFVRSCRDVSQYWEFIKHKFRSYHERRIFIWDEFRPLLEGLEQGLTPSDEAVSAALEQFDAANVHAVWSKAIERRVADPEGAITMARTLLETVCKYILDEQKVQYDESADLPKLYGLTAKSLKLSPSQHAEDAFRQILGGCASVVQGLGSLRNRLSDAHGKGKRQVKPGPRHAELAVNLSGAMATYLVQTWEARNENTI